MRKSIRFGTPRAWLHIVAAGLVTLAVVLIDPILGRPLELGVAQIVALGSGLVFLAAAFVPGHRSLARLSTNLCLAVIAVIGLAAVAEALCRIVGVDFAREESRWRAHPPYYRQPVIPTGEAFFRRPGPETWTGQVIHTFVKLTGADTDAYAAEPVQTVRYDRNGFRNPMDMEDWELVVTGDSFAELGHLPYDALFSTLIGRATGLRTLNLGTGYTGPLTQLSYLRTFGIAESTRIAMVAFFEGNDLDDLDREYRALARWKATGARGYREFRRQSSPIRAVVAAVASLGAPRRPLTTAHFLSVSGPVPVSLRYEPRDRRGVSADTRRRLAFFFEEYAAYGAEHDIELWLVFIPTKRVVLDGLLEFAPEASAAMRMSRPHDLPDLIAELCALHGIEFLDLTPALVAETRARRRLLYNGLVDTHLNAEGSRLVASAIATRLVAAGSPLRIDAGG